MTPRDNPPEEPEFAPPPPTLSIRTAVGGEWWFVYDSFKETRRSPQYDSLEGAEAALRIIRRNGRTPA